MLDKPLDQIRLADLQELIQEKWPEGKAVDYKRDMYGRTDSDKKELLKDVSSFANTDGGDLIIGVDEAGGIPTAIVGATVPDVDAEKLRLEETIRRGRAPGRRKSGDQAGIPGVSPAVIAPSVPRSWSVEQDARRLLVGIRTPAGPVGLDPLQLAEAGRRAVGHPLPMPTAELGRPLLSRGFGDARRPIQVLPLEEHRPPDELDQLRPAAGEVTDPRVLVAPLLPGAVVEAGDRISLGREEESEVDGHPGDDAEICLLRAFEHAPRAGQDLVEGVGLSIAGIYEITLVAVIIDPRI